MEKTRATKLVEKYLALLLSESTETSWAVCKMDKKIVITVQRQTRSMTFTIHRPSELLKRRFFIALQTKLAIEPRTHKDAYSVIQTMKAFRFNKLSAKRATVKRMKYAQKIQREETSSTERRATARARLCQKAER